MEFREANHTKISSDNMTYGGIIEVSDQIKNVNLHTDRVVNPFLRLHMDQIVFQQVLLQKFQVLLPDFGRHLNVLPSMPATHMPTSLFDYMTKTFFKQICSKA